MKAYHNLSIVGIITILCFSLAGCAKKYEVKNETPVSPPKAELKKVTVNIYIENSGSMDGYMHPSSEFRNDLYSYTCAIANEVKETKLNYINSQIRPINQKPEPFFAALNPNSFKAAGLDRSHSEIVDMFKEILGKMDKNSISIFASDCILDVKGDDAAHWFESKRTTLRDTLSKHLTLNKDFAIEIFCCESSFEGNLYPTNSAPVQIKGKRPYYVWVLGSKYLIGALNKKASPYSLFRTGGIKYSASFADCGQMYYTLNLRGKEDNPIIIRGKKKEFDILVDMSSSLLSEEQISDIPALSYADQKATVERVEAIQDKQSDFTHALHIQFGNTSKSIKQSIAFAMNGEPKWAESLNDDSIGVNPQKTYGIKHLIYAVSDAYKNAKPAQIQFVINKK